MKRNRPSQETVTSHIPDIEILDFDQLGPDELPGFSPKAPEAGTNPPAQKRVRERKTPSQTSAQKALPQEDSPEKNSPQEDFPVEDFPQEDFPEENSPEEDSPQEDPDQEPQDFFSKYILRVNWHLVLLAVFLLLVGVAAYKVMTWGNRVDGNYDPGELNPDDEVEVLDTILPLIHSGGEKPVDDGVTTVVAFGNSPFADDRDARDSLAAMITESSGAKVYNCAVAGSHLTALEEGLDPGLNPEDAFTLHWLVMLAISQDPTLYRECIDNLGENAPPDAREVVDTLCSIDFSLVDVVAIMYDASDYLDGRELHNPDNSMDLTAYTGNLAAGIYLLQQYFPHIRIIVMSPTYAYALDDDGNYISSDIKLYVEDGYNLSTYALMMERVAYEYRVSFLDNIYGTVNEDNAPQYLEGQLHLNKKGRQRLADRFIYALQYFDGTVYGSDAQ